MIADDPKLRTDEYTGHTTGLGKILADSEVVQALSNGEIKITPILDEEQIGPTTDLRLGTEFIIKNMDRLSYFDILHLNELAKTRPYEIWRYYRSVRMPDPQTPFVLHPGQFALGCTLEFVQLPFHIGAQLEGRSSWAREGLNVHSTAGLIHPGHRGVIVFELQNLGTHPLPLYPGTRVAQLLFYRLATASKRAYSKRRRYFGMTETTFGAPWKDSEFETIRRALFPSKVLP